MKIWLVIAVVFLPVCTWAQASTVTPESDRFNTFFEQYLLTDPSTATDGEAWDRWLSRLDRKKQSMRHDADFIPVLFHRVHYKFLKHYEGYASFPALLAKGRYNCLTGTALYALLLERYGYDYRIIETNYHIFLMITVDGAQYIFEATDPREGFVSGAANIEERLAGYRRNQPQEDLNREAYQYQTQLFRPVNLGELTGLLYYNQAVDAFNNRDFERSISRLHLAAEHYKSERLNEFSLVMLQVLVNSDLKTSDKRAQVRRVASLRKEKLF